MGHIGGNSSPGPNPKGNSSDRHCFGTQVFEVPQTGVESKEEVSISGRECEERGERKWTYILESHSRR